MDENIMENENENVIVLTDEDGTEVEFEFCASIEYEGSEYVVLLPTEDDEGEVVILQVVEGDNPDDPDEVLYVSVEDDDLLETVFQIFKEQAADDYDFEE